MADCLAGIERGDFAPSAAAEIGSEAGCPYCIARCGESPAPGTQVVLLNGASAGSVSYVQSEVPPLGARLLAALPLEPLPLWLAPFDLRYSFILDELAVWFCNAGIIGQSFHWHRPNILMLASVCWHKRIAVTGNEMARLLLGHGLPAKYQGKAADAFEFALSAMISASGRPGIRKNRDPDALRAQWAAAMRVWGR